MADWTALIVKNDPQAWSDLVSFRPPKSVQEKVHDFQKVTDLLMGSRTRVQHLELAYGRINLDYYPIQVTKLPTIPKLSRKATAEELFEYFRKNLTAGVFTSSNICEFEGFDDTETQRWLSASPVGSIVHIDMYKYVPVPTPAHVPVFVKTNPDDGSVVCSLHEKSRFIFSTIQLYQDGLHPVSGNREFGFWKSAESSTYTFYTRAADRVADWATRQTMSDEVFQGGHSLWLTFQERFESFVNSHGGVAKKQTPISKRHGWDQIKQDHFRPKEQWYYP